MYYLLLLEASLLTTVRYFISVINPLSLINILNIRNNYSIKLYRNVRSDTHMFV